MRRTGLRRHVWSENGHADHGYCPVQVSQCPFTGDPCEAQSPHTSCPHSFGYYFAILPALLNVISFIGFCAVNSIVAGQVLAAVNPGHLSVNAGIVIVAVISMLVSFCGYKVLHTMERWAWMPVLLAFIFLAGFGARHLGSAPSFAASEPATAGAVLSFISIVVGFTISWSGCSADFNTYMRPDISSIRVCLYTFAGLYLPCMLVQVMGAAFAAAALSGAVPTWEEAFGDGSVGGLVGVAVEPMRGFGKFLLVLFSLGMICESSDPLNRGFSATFSAYVRPFTHTLAANNAPTQYAFSLSLQIVFPFLTRLPRFLLPIVGTAIYLPIAIAAAAHFASALSNFLGLLGYWSSIFVAILLVEVSHDRVAKSRGLPDTHTKYLRRIPYSTCSSGKVASRHTTSRSGTGPRNSRPASPPSSPRSAAPHWSSSGWIKSGSAARSRNSSRGRTRTPAGTSRSRRAWRSPRRCISRRGGSRGAPLGANGNNTEAVMSAWYV